MRITLTVAAAALLLGCGNPQDGGNAAADPAAPPPADTTDESGDAPEAAIWSCVALPADEAAGDFRELAGVDVRDVVARADGRAVLVGAIQGDTAAAGLLLLDASGRPDASGVCGAGWRVLDLGAGYVTGAGVVAHADGSVTMAAFGDMGGANSTVLATVEADLSERSIARHADRGQAIAAAADGGILVGGGDTAPWIVKLGADGARDASFGGDGVLDCADWGGCTGNETLLRMTAGAVAFGSDAELRVRRFDAAGAVTSTWRHSFEETSDSGFSYVIDALAQDAGTVAVSGCVQYDDADLGSRTCGAFALDAGGAATDLGSGVNALAVEGGEVFAISARADGDGGVFFRDESGAFVPAGNIDVGPELGVASMALARTPSASIGLLSGLEAIPLDGDGSYTHRNFVMIAR